MFYDKNAFAGLASGNGCGHLLAERAKIHRHLNKAHRAKRLIRTYAVHMMHCWPHGPMLKEHSRKVSKISNEAKQFNNWTALDGALYGSA